MSNYSLARSTRTVSISEQHIPLLITLFEQTVRRLGPAHYSPDQVEQWALGARHPGLAAQLREHHGWVIEQVAAPSTAHPEESGGVPLGFVTLSHDGHLSLLYVSADHQRLGLGSRLLETAMQGAQRLGLRMLTTEASVFSLALFLRHGFEQTGLETVERGGVSFIRHRLHCRLPS